MIVSQEIEKEHEVDRWDYIKKKVQRASCIPL